MPIESFYASDCGPSIRGEVWRRLCRVVDWLVLVALIGRFVLVSRPCPAPVSSRRRALLELRRLCHERRLWLSDRSGCSLGCAPERRSPDPE